MHEVLDRLNYRDAQRPEGAWFSNLMSTLRPHPVHVSVRVTTFFIHFRILPLKSGKWKKMIPLSSRHTLPIFNKLFPDGTFIVGLRHVHVHTCMHVHD